MRPVSQLETNPCVFILGGLNFDTNIYCGDAFLQNLEEKVRKEF